MTVVILARRLRLVVVLLFAAALACFGAGSAWAHTAFSSSSPSDGEQLVTPPGAVEVVFTDEILDLGAQIVVAGPAGPVEASRPMVDGDRVSAALPADLVSGDYTVQWRVTAADGHPVTGELGFSVAAVAPPTETATAAPSASVAAPSPEPTGETSVAAAPEPSVAEAPEPSDDAGGLGTSRPLMLGLGALAVAVVAAGVAVRRRRG